MKIKFKESFNKINNEYYSIKEQLKNKENIIKKEKFKFLLEKYKKLKKTHKLFEEWKKNEEEIEITNSLLKEEKNFNLKNELKNRLELKSSIEKELKSSLISKEPNDIHNCLIEIHSGTGGNEASLFVEDLYKMYRKYADSNRWKIEIININFNNNYKGYKEIIFRIIGKYAYGRLKFESGGHRVQRIPETESQGRIHTSTCTIAVLPDLPEDLAIKIDNNDLKIDTYRSSGAGGQHVNTTDSAIRIKHIPTGIVVECQNERSQHKNKQQALSILKARIKQLELQNKQKNLSKKKRSLLGSGDRSVRNRTYNYPKGRITDHRINLTIYDLYSVLNGKLELLIKPLKIFYKNE